MAARRLKGQQVSDFPGVAIDDVSVVVKGAFSPAIFSPAWLALQELIGSVELDASDIEVVTSQLNIFRVGSIRFQITPDTYQVSTEDVDDFERVRDIAVGTLRALSNIPVGALGINRSIHATLGDEESWHRIGDRLSPKEFWGEFMAVPGMKTMTIVGARSDSYQGHQQITVEPSGRVQFGVYVAHNDHFLLRPAESPITSRDQLQVLQAVELELSVAKNATAIQVLGEEWESSVTRALDVVERIMRQGLGGAR